MTFKTVLVHVRPSAASSDALRLAVEFAREHQADLIGVGARARVVIADQWVASIDGTIIQALDDDETADIKEAEARFREAVECLGDRAHWVTHRTYPNDALIAQAAGVDLAVVSMETGDRGLVVNAANLVFDLGLPVVIAPAGVAALSPRSIVIAWRNTREARIAISSALPLLRADEEVQIVEVDGSESTPDAKSGLHAMVSRLRRHGIEAQPHVREKSGAPELTVLDFASACSADLIVAGAYGHSRAQEWVLGGMTQGLLSASTVPLFLCH